MGALAGLLSTRGFQVTGSDLHAYPPMSTELEHLGIEIKEGYRASNLDHDPDLVVVGNVCRSDHPEAEAARERGLVTASMPRTLCDLFLRDMKPLVIAGTHGKTTTTSLTAFLLREVGLDPSMLVGGVTADFGSGFRLGSQDWFVVEGDEYDSAYFEKVPKFLSYAPRAGAITSVEYDHIDIYPSFDDYKNAFRTFAELVPPPGPLAVYGGDPVAVEMAGHSRAEVVLYGVEGDPLPDEVQWLATPISGDRFQLTIDGEARGSLDAPLSGRHNLRNILAALVLCHRAAGVALEDLARVLPKFQGVRRRQEVLGKPGGITVYDDFAHHPTAVRETLDALAALHPAGRLIAAFEPRSATACRKLHQEQYAGAFGSAGRVVIAPPGRDLPADESLDTRLLASQLCEKGISATAPKTLEEVLLEIFEWARPGDGVVTLSNGAFGGLPKRLLETLA